MKALIAGIISVVFSFQSDAQYFFPKSGVSISWGSASSNSDPRFGFGAGAGVQFSLSKKFALITELAYIQKGYDEERTIRDITSDTELSLNYLETPILIKMILGHEGFTYYFTVGPSVSFLVKSKKLIVANRQSQASPNRVSLDNFTSSRLDVGLQIGSGVLLIRGIWIDVRYGIGLLGVHEETPTTELASIVYSPPAFRNRTFQVGLSVPVKLRKSPL